MQPPDFNHVIDDEAIDDEENAVEEWLQRVFDPDEKELEELMSQVRRCLRRSMPLTFMPDEIMQLRKLFEARVRPQIIRIMREIEPYGELWEYSKENGLRRPEFVNWYIAEEMLGEGMHARRRRDRIVERIKAVDPEWGRKSFVDLLDHVNNEIKGDRWAFKVVFQKALFDSFDSLLSQAAEFVSEDVSDSEVVDRFTTQWIEAINQLLDSDLGRIDAKFSRPKEAFWVGIGLSADETVDFTPSSSRRLTRWLNAWVCMYHLKNATPSFGTLEKSVGLIETIIYRTLLGSGTRFVIRGLIKVVTARGEVDDAGDNEAIEEAAKRLLAKRYEHLRNQVAGLAT